MEKAPQNLSEFLSDLSEFLSDMETKFKNKPCDTYKKDYEFIAEKIKEVADNYNKDPSKSLDLNPKTCLVATEIVSRPFNIIRGRVFNVPVMGDFYLVGAHDLKYLVRNMDLILKMFANKMKDELGIKEDASNPEVSTENKPTEKL